jgi:hypothetical protein
MLVPYLVTPFCYLIFRSCLSTGSYLLMSAPECDMCYIFLLTMSD